MQPRLWVRAAGGLLLLAPHLIGAPQAMGVEDEVRASLSASFAWNAMAANAALWLSLGLGVGWLYPKLEGNAAGQGSRSPV